MKRVFFAAAVLLLVGNAAARMPILASPCFTWEPPTKREDGAALAPHEIKGFVLRWVRTNSAKNAESIGSLRTGNKACYNFAYSGQYQFFIKTVDADGLESQWSPPLLWVLK